jgi:hypothetical protein
MLGECFAMLGERFATLEAVATKRPSQGSAGHFRYSFDPFQSSDFRQNGPRPASVA